MAIVAVLVTIYTAGATSEALASIEADAGAAGAGVAAGGIGASRRAWSGESCARSKIGGSQVASDAFGNALGDSIAAANGQKSSGYDDTWHDENMRRIMGLANTDAMSVMSNAGIGAAASRAGSNEGQVLDLIDKELQRVQSLRTGTGTLVDRSSLRSFDAFVREVGDSRAPYGSAMKLLDAGIEALGNRVSAGVLISTQK